MTDGLRIAMVLPEPRIGGGVPGTGRLLAHALAGLGHAVDAYAIVDRPDSVSLLDAPGLAGVGFDTGWRWGRWYSQSSRPMVSHLTQLGSRAAAARALAHQLVAEHRRRAYDVVYRFSTVELFGLGRARRGYCLRSSCTPRYTPRASWGPCGGSEH